MGSNFVDDLGRRFKLWWSGNEDKIDGVGILVRGFMYKCCETKHIR